MEWEDVDQHEAQFKDMLEYTQKRLKLLKKWSWLMMAAIILMIVHSIVNLFVGAYGWIIFYSVLGLWNWFSLKLNAKTAHQHKQNEIHLKMSLDLISKMKKSKESAEKAGYDVSSPRDLMETVSTDSK